MAQPGPPYGGFGQQPAWPAPPPPPPPPRPQSKTPIFLAIGCAALIFAALILGSIGYYAVQRYVERSEQASAPTAAPPSTGRSGDAPEPPPGKQGTVAPTCKKAAACCRRILAKAGTKTDACDAIEHPLMTDANCQSPLDSYRKAAKSMGTTCD